MNNKWFWLLSGMLTFASVAGNRASSESLFAWPLWLAMVILTIPFSIACSKYSETGRPVIEPKIWDNSILAMIAMGVLLAASYWHIWCWWKVTPLFATPAGHLVLFAASFLTITSIGGLSRCLTLGKQYLAIQKKDEPSS